MPQLNIYLDRKTERAVKSAAKRNDLSLSKWAREVLMRAAADGRTWPDGYGDLLGSVSDDSFRAPEDSDVDLDQVAEFDR